MSTTESKEKLPVKKKRFLSLLAGTAIATACMMSAAAISSFVPGMAGVCFIVFGVSAIALEVGIKFAASDRAHFGLTLASTAATAGAFLFAFNTIAEKSAKTQREREAQMPAPITTTFDEAARPEAKAYIVKPAPRLAVPPPAPRMAA